MSIYRDTEQQIDQSRQSNDCSRAITMSTSSTVIRPSYDYETTTNDGNPSLRNWELVTGLSLSLFPLFLVHGLLGAVLLRIAYTICVDKHERPSFSRAWWTTLIVASVSLPFVVAIEFADTFVPLVRLLGVPIAMSIHAEIYRRKLSVTFTQGLLMWLTQLTLIVLTALFLFVIVELIFACYNATH